MEGIFEGFIHRTLDRAPQISTPRLKTQLKDHGHNTNPPKITGLRLGVWDYGWPSTGPLLGLRVSERARRHYFCGAVVLAVVVGGGGAAGGRAPAHQPTRPQPNPPPPHPARFWEDPIWGSRANLGVRNPPSNLGVAQNPRIWGSHSAGIFWGAPLVHWRAPKKYPQIETPRFEGSARPPDWRAGC